MKNTSLIAEFRYRPIRMFLIHDSTPIPTRGQHCIPNLTTISSRGHYQYPRRTLMKMYQSWSMLVNIRGIITSIATGGLQICGAGSQINFAKINIY